MSFSTYSIQHCMSVTQPQDSVSRLKNRVKNKALGLAGQNEILIGHLYNFIQIRSNFGWPLQKISQKMASGQLLFWALQEATKSNLRAPKIQREYSAKCFPTPTKKISMKICMKIWLGLPLRTKNSFSPLHQVCSRVIRLLFFPWFLG